MTTQAAQTAFVFLVRHGQAAMPDEDGRYGLDSAELTERGIAQVQRLAGLLGSTPIQSLYCSTMLRARQSAAILGEALGLSPVVLENLHEIDVGSFEGATLELLRAKHPDFQPWIECSFFGRFPSRDFHHPASLPFPHGEDIYQMCARAVPAFVDMIGRELGRTCVFVGHAWLIQSLLCHVTQTPVSEYFRYAGSNASLNLVEVDGTGQGLLHLLNAGDMLADVAGGRLQARRQPA
jgi:broad specificity phosphatase PhoE